MTASTNGRTDAQSVYQELRTEILAGGGAPGSPLREVSLAERFGVSRTPVREALRRLEQDRLLQPGVRGMVVRPVDPAEVVQVYDMRVLLEAEAAGGAAHARGPADLARLEGLVARDRGLSDPDDATRIRTNLEFHSALWEATHNPVLVDLLQRLSLHLVHAPHSTLSVEGRWDTALSEHAALVDAVRGRDEDTARSIARNHMATARELRLRLLRDAASDGPLA